MEAVHRMTGGRNVRLGHAPPFLEYSVHTPIRRHAARIKWSWDSAFPGHLSAESRFSAEASFLSGAGALRTRGMRHHQQRRKGMNGTTEHFLPATAITKTAGEGISRPRDSRTAAAPWTTRPRVVPAVSRSRRGKPLSGGKGPCSNSLANVAVECSIRSLRPQIGGSLSSPVRGRQEKFASAFCKEAQVLLREVWRGAHCTRLYAGPGPDRDIWQGHHRIPFQVAQLFIGKAGDSVGTAGDRPLRCCPR